MLATVGVPIFPAAIGKDLDADLRQYDPCR
jgi:hypothetical protein